MMLTQAQRTMHGHLAALKGLLKRLEPEHVARDRIEARIKEAEKALKSMEANDQT